ncbi:MAG: TRAP transporter substrate-binding protein [Burkholderiaceae bacterium]
MKPLKTFLKQRMSALALAVTACAAAAPALAQTEVKIGYALAVNSHYGAGAKAWADRVEQATSDKLKFKHFPNSALGGEREMVESVQLGTLEAVIVSSGTLSNFVPEVGVADIPFLFRDLAHARKVLDGPIGQDLLAKFRARNLIALAWGEQGFRHLTNSKRPVNSPDDLKGLKIRTMENPVHLTAFRTLGAAPTPMAWPEVIGALQQGTIDGQENPMSVIVSAKLAEVQKHLTLTGHVYSPAALLVSTRLWNSLDDAGKKAMTDGARAGVVAMRAYVDDVERRGLEAVRAGGMQVVELRDRSAFQKALEPAYKQYYSRYDKALIDSIVNTR